MRYTEIKNDMRKRKTPTADPKRVRCGRYWPDCQKTLAMQGFSGILAKADNFDTMKLFSINRKHRLVIASADIKRKH